ncbi:phosphatidylinositol n-acetylglucosaminyltransferase subunit [Plasmopara halstedii]|uniref:Phosphatidylinositol n-acetylglucosaminyltransferase subunit n=1 Tax=Plasmopara halstedii TaxID=4781 RepID=A0A0N7L6M5_PLAHL|nr:phosphatidylinositol n-acetylglucosaminyltransferase subunit [Plasmopara halstedii]CEG44691.1 phosphatidylinositol n-acetylglucosaminyltransferase subunit [Plasmopara halstedii]|eukprot:XP_024581060.1 phosphatidylinositol n-acetylglucosaminyltransferase subunit [Plasmopara halstedii]
MAPMTHQWKKILYAPQPHEDNYVDKTFLEQLRTNAHVQEHDYGGMVRSAAAIIQQISAILIFYSMFEFVRQDFVSTVFLGVIDVTLAVTGFAVLRTHLEVPLCTWDTINACLLFCATLSLLSPVLRTLTKSYADDTIWVLATFLGMLHLLTHDYNYVNSGIGRFSGTISLNAAIFTAVLLGSRLQSNEHVFAFVLLAIEVFAIFPIFQREVKRYSERLHLITTAMILFLALTLTWQISGLLSVLTGAFVIFLAFVCPLWFMHVQESKSEILGPWDIAHIQPEQ